MGRRTLLILGAAIVVVAGVTFWIVREGPGQGAIRPIQTTPGPVASVAATAPSDCLMPGPAPVVPDGAAVDQAEMKAAHDRIQGFVKQLEAFQACRIAQANKSGPSITAQQKKTWLDEGDSAVDQANALARAFSAQILRYKAVRRAP